jgi:hypothetical protein
MFKFFAEATDVSMGVCKTHISIMLQQFKNLE